MAQELLATEFKNDLVSLLGYEPLTRTQTAMINKNRSILKDFLKQQGYVPAFRSKRKHRRLHHSVGTFQILLPPSREEGI